MSYNGKSKQPQTNGSQSTPDFFSLLRQGTNALQQGQISLAVNLLEQAYQLDRTNPDAALNLGGAYILSKKFKQAVAILEPLSKKDPRNPMVWTNLGAAYLGNPVLAKDADQRRAIAAFERAIEIDPTTPNVAYNLGLIYHDRQDKEKARHWFKRALEANPNDKDARNYLARLSDDTADQP